MPTMAVRERTRVLEAEEEEELVVLEGTVVLMAVVEKSDPEMLRRVPEAGSC